MGTAPTVPPRVRPAYGGSPPARVRGRLAPEAMFPADLPGYRTRFERVRSGERIRVVETGPPDGPPVVFIAGWGCSVWDFNRTLAPVGEAGYRAVAIDLRGHGLSDMPLDDALYSTNALVDHLRDVIDLLALDRPAIIGHSMGGALAVHLALREPHRLRALILISAVGFGTAPPALVGRALSPRWVTPLARPALRRAVVAVGLHLVHGPYGQVDERNVDEYWAPSQFRGFVPAMRALLHGFRWSPFTDEELERVAVPSLVIRGGHDRVIRAPRPLLALPSRFREIVVADAGHLPHDEFPGRVNGAITAFLQEHLAGSPVGR